MKSEIQKFLYLKGLNPAKNRTKVMVELIYVMMERMGSTELSNTTIFQQVAQNLNIPVNNVIQHIYQCKNNMEKIQGTKIKMTPQELAFSLAYEFQSISGEYDKQ